MRLTLPTSPGRHETTELLRRLATRTELHDLDVSTRQATNVLALTRMLQVTITWGQGIRGALRLHSNDPQTCEQELIQLAASEVGLPAALLANDILSGNGDLSLQRRARDLARQSLINQDLSIKDKLAGRSRTPKSVIGPEQPIFVYRDQQDFSSGLLRPLQTPPNHDDAIDLTTRLIAEKPFLTGNTIIGDRPSASVLAEVIYELYRNAMTWGCQDYTHKPSLRHFYGLRVANRHHATLARYIDTDPDAQPLARFLTTARQRDRTARLGYLECLVFDSGHGIAAHYAQTDTPRNITHEQDLLTTALRKHLAKKDTYRPSGYGLDNVLACLSQTRSFLYARSGRLELYRDFSDHPYQPERGTIHGTPEEPYLLDWDTGSPATPTEQPPVRGTHLLIMVPVVLPRP